MNGNNEFKQGKKLEGISRIGEFIFRLIETSPTREHVDIVDKVLNFFLVRDALNKGYNVQADGVSYSANCSKLRKSE